MLNGLRFERRVKISNIYFVQILFVEIISFDLQPYIRLEGYLKCRYFSISYFAFIEERDIAVHLGYEFHGLPKG